MSSLAQVLVKFLGAQRYELDWEGKELKEERVLTLSVKVDNLTKVNIHIFFKDKPSISEEEKHFIEFIRKYVERVSERIISYTIYKTLLDSYSFSAFLIDAEPPNIRRIIYVSPTLKNLLGWDISDVSRDWWIENVHPEDRKRVLESLEALKRGSCIKLTYRFRKKNGNYVWLYMVAKVLEKTDSLYRVAGYVFDVTHTKELEKDLELHKRMFKAVLEHLPAGLLILKGGKIIFANDYIEQLSEYKRQEILGKDLINYLPKHYRNFAKRFLRECNPEPQEFQVYIYTKEGKRKFIKVKLFCLNLDQERISVALVTEITQEIIFRKKLTYFLLYDQLTRIPNRLYFQYLLKKLISSPDTKIAFIGVVSIENLNAVNFLYGFKAGNELIKEIARSLRSKIRNGIYGRLSGRLFAFALKNTSSEELKRTLSEIFNFKLKEVEPDVRVGVSRYPEDGNCPEDLIRKAEFALMFARSEGIKISFYKRDYESKLKEEIKIKELLEESINRKSFRVVYQPIVSLKGQKVVGAETLVRWYHEELGEVSPNFFIPIAEKYGLVSKVNYIVMEKAFKELSKFVKGREFFLSVNVNAEQFYSEELIQKLEEYSKEFNFPLNRVILELTERTLMEKSEKAVEILNELKSLGVKIAIDDFGTGYSSMHYLVEFNVDEIKIDKSFIDKMIDNVNAWQVVRNIIELSHNLGALSLAEGVEKEEQVRELKKLLCDEAQGYYFSPPLPFKKLIEFVEKGKQNLIK
ncbi:MAG: hypothetical protein DSY32_00895 [Aquifex sp.]|nr:MAG: hypothetical protein DSY32_00895 [Aquifex sp.]